MCLPRRFPTKSPGSGVRDLWVGTPPPPPRAPDVTTGPTSPDLPKFLDLTREKRVGPRTPMVSESRIKDPTESPSLRLPPHLPTSSVTTPPRHPLSPTHLLTSYVPAPLSNPLPTHLPTPMSPPSMSPTPSPPSCPTPMSPTPSLPRRRGQPGIYHEPSNRLTWTASSSCSRRSSRLRFSSSSCWVLDFRHGNASGPPSRP